MTGRIFISYRRSDSQYATDRIYERLGKHFGADRVFMDIDNIPLGVNFRDYIDQQISTSDIVLTVIGDHWLNAVDSKGQLRLQNPSDFVRLEIEAALKQSITLIPLFIGGVEALPPDSLPESMKEISMLNATRIRRGDDFLPDVDRLIRGIEHIDRQQTARREENKAVLLEIEHLATEIISRLSAFEVVLIQEMRKRTQLEKEAQTIAAMAKEHLKDSRKQLRADIAEYKKQIDKLQDNLVKLALQIEARKQGAPVDDDLLFEEPEIPELQEKETPAKTPKPARERKKLFTNVPIWAWAGGVVVILALVWGLISLFSGGTPSAEVDKTNIPAETNAADTALTPTSTSNSLESAKAAWITSNHDFIFWMSEITKTTPDFIEDFSISQPYWNNYVSERAYRIVGEPPNYTARYAFTLPWETPAAYLLQFDFTPNEFAYGSHLKVQIGSDGLFRIQSDGTWELSSLSEGLELYSGTIADLNVDHTYLIKVCVWEDQIAILIDSHLVTYLEDQPFSPGPFEIVVDSYKPIDVTLDNIEIWDLSDWNYLEIPDQADARSFYTPIREHLSNTPPDFKEDFEQYLPYWDQMRVNLSDTWSVSLAEIALDGILYQSPNAEDHYRNIKLEFPDLHSESFAIQYDFLFSPPGSQDAPKTASIETSWGAADNQEHFNPYCDFYEEISEIWCGLYKTSDSGEIIEVDNQNIQFYKNIDSHYTLLAIFYDGQFVLFLDGFFMGYTDGLDLFDQQIAITVGIADPLAQSEFGVEVDNIQFWNLDSWDAPQQEDTTSSPEFDYEQMLEYVQTELPPTFEDDFQTVSEEWGSDLTNRVITSMIRDEMLVVENRHTDLKFPMTAFLNAENFVLSFDFVPGTLNEPDNGSIAVEFLSSAFSGMEYHKFKISYTAMNGPDAWLFSQGDGSSIRTTGTGAIWNISTEEFNHVQILVWQGQLAVLINDELIYQDSGLTTWGSDFYFVKGGETNSRLSMDNVTFWNLDGVEINP